MKNNIIQILIFVLLISPLTTRAEIDVSRIATENVIHDAQIFLELQNFDASSSLGVFDIWVNPGSQSINASGLVLGFATSSINILGTLSGNSFCDFFLENNFNNNTGELRLSGMKPYPGVATTSLFAQIIFEKIDNATSTISILEDESMVLANNGFATNVLATTTDLKL
ncbi:MAG: hypothetical protein PF572_04830 [Patescibacteria group bacterium]|jgi:hypothetical protein|nr:hypothetical protein [Patescibacteria group bacterium]